MLQHNVMRQSRVAVVIQHNVMRKSRVAVVIQHNVMRQSRAAFVIQHNVMRQSGAAVVIQHNVMRQSTTQTHVTIHATQGHENINPQCMQDNDVDLSKPQNADVVKIV